MFNNTLYLPINSTTGMPFVLVDGPTNRKTTRVNTADFVDDKVEFTIGHMASSENAPVCETRRTVVRLQQTKVDVETGKPITAYWQFIGSKPAKGFVVGDLLTLFTLLSGFILNGDGGSGTDLPDLSSGLLSDKVGPVHNRLMAEES